jgi:biopolymer transport protein ExbB
MNLAPILDFVGNAIYALQALSAVQGIFLVVLVFRRIAQKRFRSEAQTREFMDQSLELLQQRRFDELTQLCDSPPFWSKATPQLMLVALAERNKPIAKIKQIIASRFATDVLADLEYRMAWINTIVKTAPMLGLQGTVIGMISAFAKIASRQKSGVDPSTLASDISFALWTTAIGLLIAIPLVMAGAAIHVRISKLQDRVQQQLSQLLDGLEAALATRGRG